MPPVDNHPVPKYPVLDNGSVSINRALHNGFYLNDYFVQPDTGSIEHADGNQHIPPKALKVLMVLASYPGTIVKHKDLLKLVWDDPNTKVTQLSSVISELRHALKDRRGSPTFIQTHQGAGYRLLATPKLKDSLPPTSSLPVADNQISTVTDSSSSSIGKVFASPVENLNSPWRVPLKLLRRSKLVSVSTAYIVVSWMLIQVFDVTLPIFNAPEWGQKLVVLVLLLGLPCVVIYVGFREIHKHHQHYRHLKKEHHNPSLGIQFKVDALLSLLIIGVIGVAAQQLYISIDTDTQKPVHSDKGLTLPVAQVTENAVAILPFLNASNGPVASYVLSGLQYELIAYLSQNPVYRVASMRATAGIPPEAALELIKNRLGVKYILEGKIERRDDKLVLKTTMTDTQTGFQIWSDNLQGQLDQLLLVQTTLARRVTNALALLITASDTPVKSFGPTKDFVAFDLYMQARNSLRDASERQSLEAAETLFLQALERDEGFILASSGLCQTYLDLYLLELNTADFKQAEQACAPLIDNEITKTASLTALGNLYRTSGDYSKSETFFNQSLMREEHSLNALTGMAHLLAMTQRPQEAEALYQQIINLEPGYWKNYQYYGGFLFGRGRYQEASVLFEQQLALKSDQVSTYTNLGGSYFMTAQFNKASEAWRKSLEIAPSPKSYTNLGSALYFSLDFGQAAQMYQQATQINPTNYIYWANLGDALKFIPDKRKQTTLAFQQAIALVSENIKINQQDPTLQSSLARYLSETGDCDTAAAHEQQALTDDNGDPYIFYDLAIAALNCNQRSKALVLVDQMLSAGYPLTLLLKDPMFEAIRDTIDNQNIDNQNINKNSIIEEQAP